MSISGGSYNLGPGVRQTGQDPASANPNNTMALARRTAISSVTELYNSVLGSLTKRKPADPGMTQTPAASLGRPADSSTPATELLSVHGHSENVQSRPSDFPMQTVTSHVSRRVSHKTSTSSGASADVTVIGQSGEDDLYVDESHVYGTSQLQQAENEFPSLALTTEMPPGDSDAEVEPPEEIEFPIEEDNEMILNQRTLEGLGAPPLLEEEVREETRDESDAEEQDLESSGDLTTTRDGLSKATRTLSEAQVRTNRTQVEIKTRRAGPTASPAQSRCHL